MIKGKEGSINSLSLIMRVYRDDERLDALADFLKENKIQIKVEKYKKNVRSGELAIYCEDIDAINCSKLFNGVNEFYKNLGFKVETAGLESKMHKGKEMYVASLWELNDNTHIISIDEDLISKFFKQM